jgi:RimJ/RimL family protein N-acetyltransferase
MEQTDYIDYRAIKKIKLYEGKILIRPLKINDLAQTIIWLKDPEINKFLAATFEDLDLKKELDWFYEMNNSHIDFIFAVEDKKNKRYIGSCGLHKIDWANSTCEFGIVIGDKEYWGKNFGTDAINGIVKIAFEKLNLNKIKLFVYEYNKRAICAYKKCGFEIKDILKGDHLFENYLWDTFVMEKSYKTTQG